MKIVHVVDSASRLGGGLSESVRGFATAMVASGADVTVVAADDAHAEEDRPRWGTVPLVLAKAEGKISRLTGRGIAAALDRIAPDLVHLHGLWGVGARGAASWARGEHERHRGAVVISPHGMLDAWAMGRSAAKKRVSRVFWEGALLRNAALLHALNDAEAVSIAEQGFTRPVTTIPNGVDLPPRDPDRGAQDRSVLLFLGRLHPKKGLSELVRAWALLPADLRAQWVLRIAGWDEIGLQNTLAAEAHALGVSDGIAFPGPVYGAAKDVEFRGAAAFILPSFSEGLPMAILEAWAYDLPVMMTAACNLPKGFAAGAATEIATAPGEMAHVLDRALRDPAALRAMGAAGRALVERDHGWPAIAARMLTAYAEVRT